MVKAVAFDFGNVLAMVDRLRSCSRLARHSPLPAAQICGRIWGGEIEREAETGRIDSRQLFRRIKEAISGESGWSYEEFRAEFMDGFHPNPEGIEAFKQAHARAGRVFIISNTSYLHARWLFEQEELATLPEAFIFSFKVGFMKPDPRIWLKLLELACLEAEECLYIDDVGDYCAAAAGLGFPTIHYLRGQTPLLQELSRWL